ncbi:transposase family protein [Micromonospora sp. NPDC050795]|uniref:transposase family protein n=1 Tax=Micromonospora sp. NPDC050795 TaxID=3364282 RepID=UPI0037A5F75C
MADSGYEGAGQGIHTPYKQPADGRRLAADNRAYNTILRSMRCLGERGFAILTGRWRTLRHSTASPRSLGDIVRAAPHLTLSNTATYQILVENTSFGGRHHHRRGKAAGCAAPTGAQQQQGEEQRRTCKTGGRQTGITTTGPPTFRRPGTTHPAAGCGSHSIIHPIYRPRPHHYSATGGPPTTPTNRTPGSSTNNRSYPPEAQANATFAEAIPPRDRVRRTRARPRMTGQPPKLAV